MAVSGRTADRLASVLIYVAAGCLAIWAGTALMNHSLDSKFYKDFLLRWELAVSTCNSQGVPWPRFSEGKHVRYMEEVIRMMRSRSLSPPDSNTKQSYIYQLDRIGASEEDIFLLCFPNRIILYGISEKTFRFLDARIDGKTDPEKGMFVGRRGKDDNTYIGLWKL
jgi:hypothetical protein